MAAWQMSGDYFETCSCDYVCPCVLTNMAGKPTKERCNFAMVVHIDRGNSDSVQLERLALAVIGHTPEIMGNGNWSVGLSVDEGASAEQKEAIAKIASGQA